MSVRTDTLKARLHAREASGNDFTRFLSLEDRQTVEIAHDPVRKEFITFREPTVERILDENATQYRVKWQVSCRVFDGGVVMRWVGRG